MFQPEVFRKQMYCIEESTVLVSFSGIFRSPRSHLAPIALIGATVVIWHQESYAPLCLPSLRPCMHTFYLEKVPGEAALGRLETLYDFQQSLEILLI